MDICDLAPDYIRAIAPYQPGKPISELAREMGIDEAGIIKLASNEKPLGGRPRARALRQRFRAEAVVEPPPWLPAGAHRARQRLERCAGDDRARVPCAG